MAGGPAATTNHDARDVHRLEVRQDKTPKARKIVIVPSSVRSAYQSSALSIVGQDDAVVSECGDDNVRLRTS
jgi:hypothetical protein